MNLSMLSCAEAQHAELPGIRGVGIDMVQISRLEQMRKIENGVLLRHIFSDQELLEAEESLQPATYLAGRFAVKEAAFKAIAHLLSEKRFDLRLIQTLRQPDGSPQILRAEALGRILQDASVTDLHVSITNEADYTVAIVVAS